MKTEWNWKWYEDLDFWKSIFVVSVIGAGVVVAILVLLWILIQMGVLYV